MAFIAASPEADVVLVKLARTGRITDENILEGLEWVLENREKYNIRIVNISAGGDEQRSYLDDPLSQMVEACSAAGILVVCAVGNSGHLPNHPVVPPASAPSCIAVGGLDDNNSMNRSRRGMYRSSYGPTVDGLQKPEVIAPRSGFRHRSCRTRRPLSRLHCSTSSIKQRTMSFIRSSAEIPASTPNLDAALDRAVHSIRQLILLKIRRENVITKHYKYVDGTSFSAPIVSSVAAQIWKRIRRSRHRRSNAF